MLNYGTISVQKLQNLNFNISKKQFRKCYQGRDFFTVIFNNLRLVLTEIAKEREGGSNPNTGAAGGGGECFMHDIHFYTAMH